MTDQTVNKAILIVIDNFIENISTKYNINKDDLKNIWLSLNNENSSVKLTNKNYSKEELSLMLKSDLILICKSKNIKCTGTKTQLISYIINNTIVKNKNLNKETSVKPIFQSIIKQTPIIQIHRNQFGNYEHSETSLIFNNKTQKVIGKQNKNGDIDSLTKEDIDICNKFKFSYIIPENLDSKNTDIHVDGIDDEEELDYEDEEEIIDEEIIDEDQDEEFTYEEDE